MSEGGVYGVYALWTANPAARFLVCCAASEHRALLGGALVLAGLLGDLDAALDDLRRARLVAAFLPVYGGLRAYCSDRGPS